MRTWTIVSLALVVGVLMGAGTAVQDYMRTRADFDTLAPYGADSELGLADRGSDSGSVGQPKLQLEGESEYNFDVMSRGDKKSHTFRIKNVGTAPLRLSVLETTCMCTDVDVPSVPVPPGKSGDVTVEWTAKTFDVDFRQTATIETSDPNLRILKLSIYGRVQYIVRAVPGDVAFPRIVPHRPHTVPVVVYGYQHDELAIIQHELLQDDTKDYFDVAVRSLSDEEIAKEPGARTGSVVSVTAKPGLAIGPINQTLRLYTDALDVDPIEIPIRGSVVSSIVLYGPRLFDPDKNLLKLGPVSSKKGTRVRLNAVVKGARDAGFKLSEVEISPDEVKPEDLLKVEVGAAVEVKEGVAVRVPITVEIPPNTRSANHLAGSKQGKVGRIILLTNHPEAPALKLFVSFAVGDYN